MLSPDGKPRCPGARRPLVSKGLRIAFILSLIACGGFYAWFQNRQSQVVGESSVSVYNRGATGISRFVELADALSPRKVQVLKRPFLESAPLANAGAILIFDPLQLPSQREAGILLRYAQAGGRVLLSFQDKDSLTHASAFLKKLEIESAVRELEHFRNGVPTELAASADGKDLWRGQGKFRFYSRWVFADCAGKDPGLDCFVRHKSVGKGHIHVLLGVNPLANALLPQGGNRELAYRLIDLPNGIFIDEYHHYFSEDTLGSLVLKPELGFVIPIGGMLLASLVFLVFGSSRGEFQSSRRPTAAEAPSYRLLSEGITRLTLDRPEGLQSAIEYQARALVRLYPTARDRIKEAHVRAGTTAEKIRALTSLHRTLIDQGKGKHS